MNRQMVWIGLLGMALSMSPRMTIAQGEPEKALQTPVVNTDPGQDVHFDAPTNLKKGLPTIWLVGDSTVRNGRGDGANNQMGWGDELAMFFDTTKVNIVNRAIGGRSSRSYITEGRWASLLPQIQRGDIVLIQWGHNDGGPVDDEKARGSLPGIGDETREVDNKVTKQHETVHTFGYYLTQYVRATKERGATPILCSLIPRKIWEDGKIVRGAKSYGGWTQKIALAEHVDFIDLNEITARQYDAMGQAAVEPMFGDPHTHTTVIGAMLNAASVVAGLKALPDDPVSRDFSAKGKLIPAYRP